MLQLLLSTEIRPITGRDTSQCQVISESGV